MYEQPMANTDPVSFRCTPKHICGKRLRREKGGFWWVCDEWAHPSYHDPRHKGPKAWIAYVAYKLRLP